MILSILFLALLHLCYCFEKLPVVRIPLKHFSGRSIDAKVESGYSSNVEKEWQTSSSYNMHGNLGQGYYIELLIGKPEQLINVLVDTGSSNFAVAASPDLPVETFFNVSRSQTFMNLSLHIHVPYTQGSWNGYLGTEIIKMGSFANLTAFHANIALITESSNFFVNGSNWQGILGLAYSDIAQPNSDLMPFFDSLTTELPLVHDMFSLLLCGPDITSNNTSAHSLSGFMVIGDVDSSLYVGNLLYVPIRREWYYEVIITDIMVNDRSLGLDCKEYNFDKTIVDSGTTDLRLPHRVYNAILHMLQQETFITYPGSFWQSVDLLCWNHSAPNFQSFPTLSLSLAASANETVKLIVSPQQYLRLVSSAERQMGLFNIDSFYDCYRVSISPSDTGTVIGAVIMEGFYVVFDQQNKRLGFAQTTCPTSTLPYGLVSRVEGPFHSLVHASYLVRDSGSEDLIGFWLLNNPENRVLANIVAGLSRFAYCPVYSLRMDTCINIQAFQVGNLNDVIVAANPIDCGYVTPLVHQTITTIVAYATTAVCALCLLVVFIVFVYRRIKDRTCCRKHGPDSDDSSLLDIMSRNSSR